MNRSSRSRGGSDSSALMMTFQDMMKPRTTPAQSMYAQLPATGQALSPMARMRRTDQKIARADRDLNHLGSRLFAEGGKVASSAALNKLKAELSRLNDRDRDLAIQTLRASRSDIAGDTKGTASGPATQALHQFVATPATPPVPVVAMADGGEVDSSTAEAQNPATLYHQYTQLLTMLEDPETPGAKQSAILVQLNKIEEQLEALGVNLEWSPGDDEGSEEGQ